jgi:hypothetical protein
MAAKTLERRLYRLRREIGVIGFRAVTAAFYNSQYCCKEPCHIIFP